MALTGAAFIAAPPRAAEPPSAAPPITAPPSTALPRAEAHSADLLAVGTVRAEHMTIHLSRVVDNAPVHDAVVAVLLRGSTHNTVAEADGSYSFESPDLKLPGSAAILFEVTPQGAAREELRGTLLIAGTAAKADDGSSRQRYWWVLNFAVCIGFLWLWSRRKTAPT